MEVNETGRRGEVTTGKLMLALFNTRIALWEDLQLAQWDSHEGLNPGTGVVGQLHELRLADAERFTQ